MNGYLGIGKIIVRTAERVLGGEVTLHLSWPIRAYVGNPAKSLAPPRSLIIRSRCIVLLTL